MHTLHALAFAAAIASPAAVAGLYDQPYALVERGDASQVRKEATLAIDKIDGQTPRNPRKSDPLAPGKHVVSLHFESARGTFRPEFKEVEVDAQPCTRYRFVASYDSPMGPEWKPRAYAEPIGECEAKFAKAGKR